MSYARFASCNGYRYLLGLLIAIGAAAFGTACSKSEAPAATVSANAWAVVDGKEITQEDVEKAYRRVRDTSQPAPEEEVLTAKLSVLNDLVLQEILLAKASALKLEIPQSDIDTAYAAAKKDIADDVFQQELTRRNITLADMREGLRRELLAQKVIDQEVAAKVAVTDQEVSEFFNANRAQFNVAEEAYHIAQIVVTPVHDPQLANQTGDDAATPQAAVEKIKMLMDRLKGGARFRDLAVAYSEDPESMPRGGDLGLVPVSRLKQAPAALRDAVLNKAAGTVTVVSGGGIHTIVLVVSKEAAGQRDLSTPGTRERITEALRGRKEQLLRTAYLLAVRTNAKVVNYLARRLVESKGQVPSLQPAAPGSK